MRAMGLGPGSTVHISNLGVPPQVERRGGTKMCFILPATHQNKRFVAVIAIKNTDMSKLTKSRFVWGVGSKDRQPINQVSSYNQALFQPPPRVCRGVLRSERCLSVPGIGTERAHRPPSRPDRKYLLPLMEDISLDEFRCLFARGALIPGVPSRWEVSVWDMCTFHSGSTQVRH